VRYGRSSCFGSSRRRNATESGGWAAEEAGELLGMSGLHFRRLLVRYEEEGEEGLRDPRLGKPSPRRASAAELSRMHILYQERYRDFTVKHFHEQLQKRHATSSATP
jgi:transposase